MLFSLRCVAFGVCALVAAAFMPCAAQAAAEFCPARVAQMHAFAAPNDGLSSFFVSAESERSVSGTITIQTDKAWYTVPFSNIKLSADVAHYKDSLIQFDRTLYHSKLLYLRLPPGESTKMFWVSDATTTGETTFGWDAQGHVLCPDEAGSNGPERPLGKLAPRVNDTQSFDQLPSSGDDVATAVRVEPPAGLTSCAAPFVGAVVKRAISPDWPEGVWISREASTYVEVAVAADGKLVDAWVYQPSGLPELDFAALKSARRSSYQAGVSLCQPAPGTYLFTATFRP